MLNVFGLSDYYVKLPFWGVVESSLCLNSDLFLPSLAVTVLWLSRPYVPEINLHFPPFSDDWTWLNTLWYIFFFSVCFTNVHLDFINLYVNRAFYFVFVPLHGRVLIIVLLFLPQKNTLWFYLFLFSSVPMLGLFDHTPESRWWPHSYLISLPLAFLICPRKIHTWLNFILLFLFK